MEFEITCPIDGPVTVSLEDIDTVVLREPHRAEITFVCPQCGNTVTTMTFEKCPVCFTPGKEFVKVV